MGVADEEIDGRGWHGRPRPLVRFGAIGEAWDLFQQQWGTWMLAILIVLIGYWAINGMIFATFRIGHGRGFGGFRVPLLRPEGQLLQVLQAVLSWIIIGFFLGGMFRMACQQVRGYAVRVETLFSVFDVLPE